MPPPHTAAAAVAARAAALQLFSQIEQPSPATYAHLAAMCNGILGVARLLAALAAAPACASDPGSAAVSLAALPDWYAAASAGLRCLPLPDVLN